MIRARPFCVLYSSLYPHTPYIIIIIIQYNIVISWYVRREAIYQSYCGGANRDDIVDMLSIIIIMRECFILYRKRRRRPRPLQTKAGRSSRMTTITMTTTTTITAATTTPLPLSLYMLPIGTTPLLLARAGLRRSRRVWRRRRNRFGERINSLTPRRDLGSFSTSRRFFFFFIGFTRVFQFYSATAESIPKSEKKNDIIYIIRSSASPGNDNNSSADRAKRRNPRDYNNNNNI